MRVSRKISKQLLEGAHAMGIERAELLAGLGPVAANIDVEDLDWDTFALVLDRAAELLGGGVESIRALGREVSRAPSYAFLKLLARTVISLPNLYDAGARWVAPANFPHLPLEQTFLGETRLRVRGSIPAPHAPCSTFFHVFEGMLVELPAILGLPCARIVSSDVTPRTIDVVIELPPSRSLFVRARRAVRARLYPREVLDLLEQQRKELEEGLHSIQQSTSEIQALFDRLPDLVIIHREGTILWKNRATATTLGYANDDLVGRSLLDVVAPASRELVRRRMTGEVDGTAPDLLESWLVARDGHNVLVEVSPSQIVSFGGRPARLVVGRDVTERARLQQQLFTADRMASIGMLAAGVAHEVNNPLAYVLNNVEIAIKALAPLGEVTQPSRDALAVALEGVDHIRTIVRDLLVLSRVDDRAVGPVDVRSVVESTLALAAKRISERAQLKCEYHPVPFARGTVARLGQVLINLLSNALEAMPEGARETNQLGILVRGGPDGCAVVEVSDNGVGILPEHAPRIFDPFYTTKAFGSGTGLGLSISQRLVAESGGELTFESVPQQGSTFRVTLPAAEHEEVCLRSVRDRCVPPE